MTNVPAGWFPSPDSHKPGMLRWWDGVAWTELEHTDYSGLNPAKLRKDAARKLVGEMQQTVTYLEDIINRHGLRQYENFTEWRQERIDGLNRYHADIDQEVTRLTAERDAVKAEAEALRAEVISLTSSLDMQEVGLFEYEHPAGNSVELSTELEMVRMKIKSAIKNGYASSATQNFTFNNSVTQGKRFVNTLTKLMLRAYNAEAENAIKTTKAGNLSTAQARLTRAVEQIAKNGSMIDLQITDHFHELRLKEIELAHRHMKALQRERELERDHKAELREQRKAEQELKKEQERLEKERTHYKTALAALQAKGDNEGVERMLAKLADVDRAIEDVDYRAANIRAGYVYVISNVGSFGANVVKIGMTRRLEPMDRVRELGDASVPFRFDVHALFFADDAVAIENTLHKEFSHTRINQVNMRREYFQTTPEQVLEALKQHQVEVVEFTLEPEAEEFKESENIRATLRASISA